MRIKMLTILAGPKANWEPGQEVTVSDEFGAKLVEGRFAVEVQKAVDAPEVATAPAAPRTAATRTKPAARR